MSRTDRAAKGVATAMLQYGVLIALQLVLAPLVLRTAGQETLGAYAIIGQAIGYLGLLDLGFSIALSRFLAQAHGQEDQRERFCNVLTISRTFMLGIDFISAALLWILSLWVEKAFMLSGNLTDQARIGLQILAIWAMVRTPWSIYHSSLIATQNLAIANLIGIAGNIARLFLSVALLLMGQGLIALMAANILSEILITGLSAWAFRKKYPKRQASWGIPDKLLFRNMLSFGSQSMLLKIAFLLVFSSSNIVVGYLFGTVAASVYYTTLIPVVIGYNIVFKLADSANPAINELYGRNEYNKLHEIFLVLHRYTLLMTMPLIFGILLFHEQVINLWVGSAQYAGKEMTWASMAFVFLITTSHVSNFFVIASGKIRVLSFITLAEGVANLILSLWLGQIMGLAGVMLASVIANLVTTSYIQVRGMSEAKVSLTQYLKLAVCPTIVPAVAAYFVVLYFKSELNNKDLVNFITMATIFLSTHVVISYFFSITKLEKVRAKNYFRKFIVM